MSDTRQTAVFDDLELWPDAQQLQALQKYLTQAPTESPLEETPVSDFPSPMQRVMFSLPRLDRLQIADVARQDQALLAGLPRHYKLDDLLAGLRLTWLPCWYLLGHVTGQWQAQGVSLQAAEMACPSCAGTGRGHDKQKCEDCWGQGTIKDTHKQRRLETGQVEELFEEVHENQGTGLSLGLQPMLQVPRFNLPDDLRARLNSLRPASIYADAALDQLKLRLARAVETRVRTQLSQYSRVEDIRFEPLSMSSRLEAAVWLYPLWLAGDGKHVLVGDAHNGQLSLVATAKPGAHDVDAGGEHDLAWLAGSAAVGLGLMGAGAWLLLS